jgi:hypothetical protein
MIFCVFPLPQQLRSPAKLPQLDLFQMLKVMMFLLLLLLLLMMLLLLLLLLMLLLLLLPRMFSCV